MVDCAVVKGLNFMAGNTFQRQRLLMGHVSQNPLTQINTKTDASQVSYFHFKQSLINLCSYKSHFSVQGWSYRLCWRKCNVHQGCFSEDDMRLQPQARSLNLRDTFLGVLDFFFFCTGQIEFWSSTLLKWKVAGRILRTGCHVDLFTSSISLAHLIEETRFYIFSRTVSVTCLLPSC